MLIKTNKIKYILILLLMVVGLALQPSSLVFADDTATTGENRPEPEYDEPEACATATEAEATVSTDISGSEMFAKEILTNMNTMMVNIYRTLGKLYMLGHGLICYSKDVDPINVLGITEIVRANYFIPGALIYLTGFFLSMAIGMYFVDIAFKLGFAVLFLPISLGLWPFPPTKDKFLENINIVIHNAMLFACAAIGTAYAVKLIEHGIIGGNEGMDDFWNFINASEKQHNGYATATEQKYIKDNMEQFTQKFAIDTTNILVILFSLFFAFKIVGQSVGNYLNRFFGEGSLGSAEHAMHHMGTQAIGFATNHTIGAAGRFARDAAFTQTGRALGNIGKTLSERAPNTKFGEISGSQPPIKPEKFRSADNKDPQFSLTLENAFKATLHPQKTIRTLKQLTQQGVKDWKNAQGFKGKSALVLKKTGEIAVRSVVGNLKNAKDIIRHPQQTLRNAKNEVIGAAKNASQTILATDAGHAVATAVYKTNNYTRPTGHSLTVGNAFKAVRHPQQAYKTIKKLAQQGIQDWKNADGVKEKGSLVLKKSGQIVLRSVRGNLTEAKSSAMKITGGFLGYLGKSMENAPAKWQQERQNRIKQKNQEQVYDTRDPEREAKWGMDNAERY